MGLTTGQMELPEEAIRKHYPMALTLIDGFDYAPRIAKPAVEVDGGEPVRRSFRATTPGLVTSRVGRAEPVHLLRRVNEAGGDGLMTPMQSRVLQCLRRGVAVASAVGDAFADRTGLADLKRRNFQGGLAAAQSGEFGDLLCAEALIVLFVMGSYLSFGLSDLGGQAGAEPEPIEEVVTDNAALALHGALWELDRIIARHGGSGDEQVVTAVLAYAEALMQKVVGRAQNRPALAGFEQVSWRIEAEGFTVSGFSPARSHRVPALAMAFKKPAEVVGNHIAKYQAMKLAKMVMAYDFQRQLNPFAELGGFIFTFMGDGKPGTGKTTLIQMMAGLLHEYCLAAGYPFHYQNFGIDNIDSYQGKSGQNARTFVSHVMDPRAIGFGTIDDIDQIAGKRGDRQSSAGQQEVTAVLMEAFAGANTVVRGNCTFGMFSNFPENVDDALRQRAGARFLIDGPRTSEDYIDILSLLLGAGHDIPLGQHDLFAAQALKQAVATSYAAHDFPQEGALAEVYERIRGVHGAFDTVAKLGLYLKAIQEADPRFTGRAVKNITDAVKVRSMDFEIPDDWMEQPDLFLRQSYETKLAMISDLRRPITAEMVVQEINRYADSEFRYALTSDEAAIDRMVRDMQRAEAAQRRLRGERA